VLTQRQIACWLGLFLVASAHAGPSERIVTSLQEMRFDKVVKQEWDLSCGAAALTTLLKWQHGDPVSEKDVATGLIKREEYVANPQLVQIRQGFSLLDLKRYVDERGYKGVGFGHMTLDDLEKRAPILVPINTIGYNHFVVYRGKKRNRVLLADPAWGNRTMTIADFEHVWIDYPDLGHVGFTVVRGDGADTGARNPLAPRDQDFLTFN